MMHLRIMCLAGLILFLGALTALAGSEDRIYGTIETVDGDTFTGFIRWDKNEAAWVDVLDGTKELPESRFRSRSKRDRRRSSLEVFGIEIAGGTWHMGWPSSAESGLRFGHIKRMEVSYDDEVLLILKTGEEVVLLNGSTDIGDDIREIIMEDEYEGEIELGWDDIESIDFSSAPGGLESEYGNRLWGTMTTRRGSEYTGYVCWDIDEVLGDDILDGNDRRRKRKIRFDKIKSIERYSSSGATVVMADGDEMVLRETNDVDSGNRGIIISDPGFGQVRVDWDEFDRLEFSNPPRRVTYDEFNGGPRLRGTVTTEDGEKYSGDIRWDNDEEFGWELLQGENRGVEFEIEFGFIKKIEKRSRRSAIVTVWDGRQFSLRGSNDVDQDNKGIIIDDDVEIDWEDFASVEFERP